jgi:hypothetical protein
MTPAALCGIAISQLLEAMARLALATSRLRDPEDIEQLALAVSRLAYDAEHRATFHQREDED